VRERATLQVRAEAFNVFNNTRFNALNVNNLNATANTNITLSAPAVFGTIAGAQDPRILQLALKVTF
jgi:hypothetical protein